MLKLIREAQKRLEGQLLLTPVLRSRTLDERVGVPVFFKCENFQRTGSFKLRGAFNAMAQLSREEREAGVLTVSSGNHGQGVALAGKILSIKTTILMPHKASAAKREAIAAYGASIVECDFSQVSREETVASFQSRQGGTFVPPFDDLRIIAGQGTVALEFFEQTDGLDTLLAPCGGGGLLSGTALAAKHLSPSCRVVGVEPALADDANRSFRTGTIQIAPHADETIADGVRSPSVGRLPFGFIRQYVDDMATVSEEAIKEAVRFFFYRMKIVVEPSGAVALAGLLSGAIQPRGRVGIIVSGGNVDGATMAAILAGPR
jgi:threonine dehydratase